MDVKNSHCKPESNAMFSLIVSLSGISGNGEKEVYLILRRERDYYMIPLLGRSSFFEAIRCAHFLFCYPCIY